MAGKLSADIVGFASCTPKTYNPPKSFAEMENAKITANVSNTGNVDIPVGSYVVIKLVQIPETEAQHNAVGIKLVSPLVTGQSLPFSHTWKVTDLWAGITSDVEVTVALSEEDYVSGNHIAQAVCEGLVKVNPYIATAEIVSITAS